MKMYSFDKNWHLQAIFLCCEKMNDNEKWAEWNCCFMKELFVFVLNGQSPLRVHRSGPTNLGHVYALLPMRKESTYVLYKRIHLTVLIGHWTIIIQPSSVTSLPLTIMCGPWSVCMTGCLDVCVFIVCLLRYNHQMINNDSLK